MIKKVSDQIWFPFWVDKWIFGSMRLEFAPEERAIWIDLLALAAKDDGYIRANAITPYLAQQLAGMLVYSEEFFSATIEKFVKKEKLQRDQNGILYITNWEKYKLSDSYKRWLKHKKILPENTPQTESVCEQMENVGQIKSNQIKSNQIKSEKNDMLFEDFWKSYPREGRVEKKTAYKKFMAIANAGKLDELKEGFRGYMDYLKHRELNEGFKQRAKDAKTFLNHYDEFSGFKYEPKL